MEAFLQDGDPGLGSVPGPLALASRDGVIWAAGGGRGYSALLRFDAEGWRATPLDAQGLRAVLPLGGEAVVVAGEYGYLAVIDGGDVRPVPTPTRACLHGLAQAGELIWVTGGAGFVATLDPYTGELNPQPQFASSFETVIRVVPAPGGDLLFITDRQLVRRGADGTVEPVLTSEGTPLTDAAYAPDGRLAVTGDQGQLFLAAPGGSLAPCHGAPSLDLECVRYDPRRDGFLVAGERGFTGVLGRDGELQALPAAAPPYRLSSILPWGEGHLYAGWIQQGPPYQFRGALYFDADDAPSKLYLAPRQDFGPPRMRTVGYSGRPVLTADDGVVIPVDEARRRMPGVEWPDFPEFDEVRFYDGDVHVTDTEALFDISVLNIEDGPAGFGVAISGDLIVDGALNATAGGDGYGSLLVVQGDVWAQAALFRYAIGVCVGGTLEVATVVLCDHGDDGGSLSAKAIRAQVVAYSSYFPLPEAEIDAFCIGDVYGDASFPPGRANEVFVLDVLEDGWLDVYTAGAWLREGRPILRAP
jgi:hypothetical protein